MSEIPPKFSVIVPVYNCAATIGKCLDALSALDHPSYEIIIVDDGSTDDTALICRAYPQAMLVRTANGGPARARNRGAGKASGEFIAFTDGDCIVDRYWLGELEKGFTDARIAGVGGNQNSPADESDFGRYVQMAFSLLGFATSYMRTPSHMSATPHNPSCNSAYRKDVFLETGGFDESLWPGEDVDLDLRITRKRYRLLRNPQALVYHYRPSTVSGLARMMQRYGGSACRLFRRYGFFRPLQIVPFATLALLLAAIAGIIHYPGSLNALLLVLPGLFLLFFMRAGTAKGAAVLCFLSLVIIAHWHVGYFKTAWTRPASSMPSSDNFP